MPAGALKPSKGHGNFRSLGRAHQGLEFRSRALRALAWCHPAARRREEHRELRNFWTHELEVQ
jgi:hypothetical protein